METKQSTANLTKIEACIINPCLDGYWCVAPKHLESELDFTKNLTETEAKDIAIKYAPFLYPSDKFNADVEFDKTEPFGRKIYVESGVYELNGKIIANLIQVGIIADDNGEWYAVPVEVFKAVRDEFKAYGADLDALFEKYQDYHVGVDFYNVHWYADFSGTKAVVNEVGKLAYVKE